jgi:hypothetical protein
MTGYHCKPPGSTMDGRALIAPDGEMTILEGTDPTVHYAESKVERKAIAHIASLDNAGDIIMFRAYDPERDYCICFDDQVGAHGAMGGRQFWPFIMNPRGLIPDDYQINDPLDLYPLFNRYPKPGDRGAAE